MLGSLAPRGLKSDIEIPAKRLRLCITTLAFQQIVKFSIESDSATERLLAVGDTTDRIRMETAFAKLCDVFPVTTFSGRTSGRYRLNRRRYRQAKAARCRMVILRTRWHQPTIDPKGRGGGHELPPKDIVRCLKRYVAREFHTLLPPVAAIPYGHGRAAEIDLMSIGT